MLLDSDTQLNQKSYYEASAQREPLSEALRGDVTADVLVVGAEIMSRVVQLSPAYRDTAILFGDGAGAWVGAGAGVPPSDSFRTCPTRI